MGPLAAAGAAREQVAAVILEVAIRRKGFGAGKAARPVLADLAFSLGANEIVAVVGPSGCGKTTLLRLIAGLDAAFEGRITWPGLARPRLGVVFQEPRLLPWRTIWQNLALVLPPGQEGAAEALLHRLGLWPHRDAYPGQISLGMARRAAIARAFAVTPDLVLLDEPFASLDAVNAALGRAILLEAWRARPTAALLVTHDLLDAAALADRVLILAGPPSRIAAEIPIAPDQRRNDAASAERLATSLRAAIAKGAISGS